jgi:hypothetical protein
VIRCAGQGRKGRKSRRGNVSRECGRRGEGGRGAYGGNLGTWGLSLGSGSGSGSDVILCGRAEVGQLLGGLMVWIGGGGIGKKKMMMTALRAWAGVVRDVVVRE